MKIKVTLLLSALLILATTNLHAQEVDQRKLSTFTEVSLKIDANLYVIQDDEQSFEIKGKATTIEKVITEVKNRKLIIRYSTSDSWLKKWNPGTVDIYIAMPQIDALAVAGSGNIITEGEINSQIISLAVSGSGNIKIDDLNAKKVSSAISGSGDILLKGKGTADELKIAISGSGDVKALSFPAREVSVKVAGSGDCGVNAINNLNVRVAGSGDVMYRGNPLVDSSVAGSGELKKLN